MFKSVILYTHKLQEMRDFYSIDIELALTNSTDDSFTIQVGDSSLTFKQSNEPATYHFAFNILGSQIAPAKNWLDGRVSLNLEDGKDQTYYESFDADAIYFEDPTGNVVEFIGRRNRKAVGDFTTSSILNISEVSITTPHVTETAKKLDELGIHSRNDNPIEPESLNFLGSEDTYIILVPPKRRWYFSNKMSITCPLEIAFFNHRRIAIDFEGNITIAEDLY